MSQILGGCCDPGKRGVATRTHLAFRGWRRAVRVMLPFVAVLVAPLVGVGVARATPPGQNGLISYREYFDPTHSTGALFVVNPNGTDPTQITFPGAGNLDTNQNWSPDGTRIVYEHDTADGSSSIWIVGVLGANPHEIVPCPGPGVLAAVTKPASNTRSPGASLPRHASLRMRPPVLPPLARVSLRCHR